MKSVGACPKAMVLLCSVVAVTLAQGTAVEVSEDGQHTVVLGRTETDGRVAVFRSGVPYGTAPDWENDLRRQVGALQVVDMNGDGLEDVVVGCYHSDSYPPYEHWENLIYFNIGGELEASPSWVSTDEVSTGDLQVADINDDSYPDIFAANGGVEMSPSVIYWGGPSGPSPTPGWVSAEPGRAWNNYALPFDFDHDGDVDVITANQGNSPSDPYRPIYIFFNAGGTLATVPGWQSAETSIQNFLAFADYDRDGWEDLAVSKWVNFESGIYRNLNGQMQITPAWTTGDDDSDKGVAWADVDGDSWSDLALGHDPTQLWGNDNGTLSVVWTSGASYFGHSDIRFCDVDRDGDEDLAEVHFSDGKVHIYLNENGTLAGGPSWTYDSPTVGTAIAFGLINADAWPDLVVGNSGEPCVKVFYAQPSIGVDTPDAPAPSAALSACYPNPLGSETAIRFRLGGATGVRLEVFSIDGTRVCTLLDQQMSAGDHQVLWDGRNGQGQLLPSGVYFCHLVDGARRLTARVSILR